MGTVTGSCSCGYYLIFDSCLASLELESAGNKYRLIAQNSSIFKMFRTAVMSFSFSGMTLIRGFTGLKAETANNDPLDKYKNIDLRLDDKDNFLQTISPDEG